MKRGVLVASDYKEEWLLPWWWEFYTRYNQFPVTFVDWGMTEEAKEWCRKRGTLVSKSLDPRLLLVQELSSSVKKAIEAFNGYFLDSIRRPFWFSKPVVMRETFFEETIWVDLDCEILGPLDSLFDFANCPAGVAIARDTEASEKRNRELNLLGKEEILYNSGVIAFKKHSSLIDEWAELCLNRHAEFFGDQNVFSYLVHTKKYHIRELPETYNWRISQGLHFSARIIHWVGSWGKAFIKKHGGLHPFLYRK